MATIGLVIRQGVKQAVTLGEKVIDWASKNAHSVKLERETAKLLGSKDSGLRADYLASQADPIITLGGDGTLIGVARYVSEKSPALIGVNFGNLGFLTEVAPSELIPVLESVFEGKAAYGERSILLAEIFRNKECVFSSQAVNDAVVQKGTRDKLLELDVGVDKEPVMRVRGDGLIIATPTGSTAYSLAAGGSIVFPSLSVVMITPICPHSLTNRPLILPLQSEIQVTIPPYEGRIYLSIDGQVSSPLQSGDLVKVTKSPNTVKFVRSPAKSYFEILRTKLNWGIGNSGS